MKILAFALVVLLYAHALGAKYEMNELPMYGGQHDPQVEHSKENSKGASELGWKYLYRGDPLTAMKRFNQSWMFDRKNPDAFWGFGIIMGQRARKEDTEKNLTESINLLTTAHELSPSNGRITGDLAFSYTILGNYLETQGRDGKQKYEKAEELFVEAYKRDPKYPPIIANWAVLKFYVGDYRASKKLISEAQELGYAPDPKFMKELNDKTK
jgi:tetratricopeptide (TPR) repeat protein